MPGGDATSHPPAMRRGVDHLPALHFADSARRLGTASRAAGLTVPAFRCPPRCAGAARTVRRYPGGAVMSVSLRGRPFEQVLADMVEGVLVANRVEPAEPTRCVPSCAMHSGAATQDSTATGVVPRAA